MPVPFRPELHFDSYEAILADVEKLQAVGWEKCGKWSLAMICDHQAKWIHCMLDGGLPGIPGPLQWIARAIIRRMAVNQKYPWIKLYAPSAMKPSDEVVETAAVADLQAAVARLDQMTGPTVSTHPFGVLSSDDFRTMTLLHAAHHLAFLRPLAGTAF